MRLRSDGFPATTLVTALAIVWAVGIGLAAGRAPTGSTAAAAPAATSTPARAAAPAPAPAAAQATGFVGDDTCTDLSRAGRQGPPRHAARQGAERAHAGGQDRPELRDLPRSRPGARRHRRQDQDQAVHGDVAEGRQRDLPDLSQQGLARAVERRDARRAQPLVRELPQRPQPEVGAGAAEDGDGGPDLRDLPQAGSDEGQEVRAHAGARRQDGLHHLPHAARLDQRPHAQGRATPSTRRARAATPRSAGRSCTITPPGARAARAATIRTGRTTTACWSPRSRCSASAATSAAGIRRRSTTARRSRPPATGWSDAAASTATRKSTGRTTPRAKSSFGNRQEDVMRTRSTQHGCRAPADLRQARRHRTRRRRPTRPRRTSPKTAAATIPDIPLVNQIDFGVRGTSFGAGSDEARYQRYRDLRDGGTLDRLRIFKDTDAYRYSLQADNVGYRDQRFSASYIELRQGEGELRVEPDPALLQPDHAARCTTSRRPGTLTLNDSVQSGIQNKTLTLADRADRRVGLRPPDAARRRELRADLQRDAERRPQRHLQEHAEDRRLSVGRQLRDQRRDRHRAAGAGRSPDHRRRDRASSTPTIAASRGSATTGRSSTTTSPR